MSSKDQPPDNERTETSSVTSTASPKDGLVNSPSPSSPLDHPSVDTDSSSTSSSASSSTSVTRQNSGFLVVQRPEPVALSTVPSATVPLVAIPPLRISSSPSLLQSSSPLISTSAVGIVPAVMGQSSSSNPAEDVGDPADKLGLLAEKDVSMIAQQFRQSYIELVSNARKPNVLIVGTTGAGKSSLINSVFGKRLAQEGAGVPITAQFQRYAPEDGNVVIYDSRGLEHGNTQLFIDDTRKFFQGLSPEDSIHVVWYVINGAGSRIQPFEEEICRTLFADIPIIFLINKADISTDEDRSILRETLTQLDLPSCVGIFDTVSGDHPPLLNVTKCPKCGSDDLDIRKKKGIATCLACGETVSLLMSTDGLIAKTLETLPVLAREAFIAAQTSSCRHKERRAKMIIREYYQEASEVRYAKPLLKCIARMLVRLSVLWDFRENGKTLSTEIAQDLLRREFSFREKILLFLRYSHGELLRTTAIGVIWNRCLRKIFISIFINTAAGFDEAVNWRAAVQRCFVDMNESEQAAVENWLEKNTLDSLLDREMPETPETVIPSPLVPEAAEAALRALLQPSPLPSGATTNSPVIPGAGSVPNSPRVVTPPSQTLLSTTPATSSSPLVPTAPTAAPTGLSIAVGAADLSIPLEGPSPRISDKHPSCRVLIPDPAFMGVNTATTTAAPTTSGGSTGTNSPSTPITLVCQPDEIIPQQPLTPHSTVAPVIVKKPAYDGSSDGPKLDEEDLAELEQVAAKESYINTIETAVDLENALKRKVTVPGNVPSAASTTATASTAASAPIAASSTTASGTVTAVTVHSASVVAAAPVSSNLTDVASTTPISSSDQVHQSTASPPISLSS